MGVSGLGIGFYHLLNDYSLMVKTLSTQQSVHVQQNHIRLLPKKKKKKKSLQLNSKH